MALTMMRGTIHTILDFLIRASTPPEQGAKL